MDEKYFIFMVGEQRYCMKLEKISSIEVTYNIVPIPVGAPFMKGITHLRGQVIPVYNIKEKFQLDEGSSSDFQLIVIDTHNIKMGIEVDSIVGIVSIPNEDVREVPSVVRSEETGYLESVIKYEDNIIVCISADTLMTDDEFDDVTKAIEEQQDN